jgi:hypothetical protein
MYSLAQAAKASGKSKPTIMRAIKAGKVSAMRRDDGSYQIDPAELHRVYPVPGDEGGTVKQSVPLNGAGTFPGHNAADSVHTRLAVAEAELRLKDEIIAELRRTNALLMDQRQQSVASVSPPGRRRAWWPWRRG